jgi:fructokinase
MEGETLQMILPPAASARTPVTIGVELGGTKVLVASGDGPMRCTEPVLLPTGRPEATTDAIISAIREMVGARPLAGIGIASFGPIEVRQNAPDYGRFLDTPKAGWSGFDLLGKLGAAFHAPIALDTDVNAAALAEGRFGAARGFADHAYITVGTGVGVGLVAGGKLIHGAGHPEAGHLLLRTRPEDSFSGACAWHGACVEGMISGPALQARLGTQASDIPDNHQIWDIAGDYLAQLCAALVFIAAPSRIVVGGGVGKRPQLLSAARAHLARHLAGYLPRYRGPESIEALLKPAALEHAGLVGAFVLAGQVIHLKIN